MSRNKKQSLPSSKNAIRLKAQDVFLQAYAKSGRISSLMAFATFSQYLDDDSLPIPTAHRILNSEEQTDKILKAAEETFLKSEQGKISEIHNRTAFVPTLTSGLISGAISSLVISALFYFLPATQRPTVEGAFKAVAKEISEIKASVQRLEPASAKTNVYNFNFGHREDPQPEPIDKKAQQRLQNSPYI